MGHRLLAGGGAGMVSCAMTYPLDLVRTRLSAQTTVKTYDGVGHALRSIYAAEGASGTRRPLRSECGRRVAGR